jgi:predicted amidophosphoribosyltransferase
MIKIKGPWKEGYAFDIHTTGSTCAGYNDSGYPTFDTTRSPMGQCLYELKYKQQSAALDSIVDIVLGDASFNEFIEMMDIIIPVPPSNQYRSIQPVLVCSRRIAEKYDKKLRTDIICSKNKEELKNVPTEQKYDKIRRSIVFKDDLEKTKRLLIFDDVFDSGSTIKAIADVFIENGYRNIYVFTLTKTRKPD